MSIEFCFVDMADESEEEWDHYLVEPGEGVLVGPYNADEQGIVLAIMCNKRDDGGVVKVLPTDGTLKHAEFKGVTTNRTNREVLPTPIGSIDITEERPHEQPVSDDSDNNGYVRVRYVRSDEITESFQIPRGLAHPN